ncbi:MAG: DMT family transporter [Dethiosulfatibacter sp.]|nr:DMT family transporter [Dethiosulfatibacter sp.]
MTKTKGILLIMMASSIFGLMPLFARIGTSNGLNSITIIMFRSFFASIFLYLYMRKKGIDRKVDKSLFKDLVLVSFFGYGLMLLTMFSSYNYLPTGIATTIHFVYPAVVLIGSVIFHKEKLTIEKIGIVLAAFAGIYLLSAESGRISISIVGFLLAFISGVFYAYYILKVSYSNLKAMNSYVLVFHISMHNFFYFLITALLTNTLTLDITIIAYLDVILLAMFSIVAMSAFKTGLNYISSWSAAILSSFEPLTSILVGVIIFKETFNIRNFFGTGIIILSVVYIALIEKRNEVRLKSVKTSVK